MATREKIKVLVVDDSLVCRELIKHILETDSSIEVVGMAKNGKEACELIPILKPSLITMDIHMPIMDGVEATEYIMAYYPTPILVVSSSVHQEGIGLAFDALKAGALDVLKKPEPQIWSDLAEVGEELIRKVKMLHGIKVITHLKGKKKRIPKEEIKSKKTYKILAIGASTGGPKALFQILSKLPADFPLGILVAQHIADGFIDGLVEWLDAVSPIKVRKALDGDEIRPGEALVSPTACHMVINEEEKTELVEPRAGEIYCPSIDLLFFSVAKVFNSKAIGVILTGMGTDGAAGLKRINESGGYTLAQDEHTSTVYGMPKVALDMGGVEKVLPVDEMSQFIISLL